ncbi:MAG: 4'-phosphopantetheinyl transferase family protein [Thermomicrobiales bacterium]
MVDNCRDHIWRVPPPRLALGDDEVQVWRASLDATPERIEQLSRTLTADERARAERFRFARDRARSIVARGVLREIIGRVLAREPGALAFRYNAFGKPSLPDESGRERIRFNLSHADGIALYALTRHRAVGVDIERVRADMAGERIAERFFSAREVATLRALDPALQPEAFFACWTRKEAYKKARGEGISVGLDRFDVSLAPNEPAALLASREADEATSRWDLHHLTPHPGYVGAVAVEGDPCGLTCWQWQQRSSGERSRRDMVGTSWRARDGVKVAGLS